MSTLLRDVSLRRTLAADAVVLTVLAGNFRRFESRNGVARALRAGAEAAGGAGGGDEPAGAFTRGLGEYLARCGDDAASEAAGRPAAAPPRAPNALAGLVWGAAAAIGALWPGGGGGGGGGGVVGGSGGGGSAGVAAAPRTEVPRSPLALSRSSALLVGLLGFVDVHCASSGGLDAAGAM